RIVDFLYQKPVTSSQELQSRLSLSRATCDRLITQLVQDCILKEITGRQRNRHFVFSEYYQLFLK
ncbi:MAG: Fic family protein, partial [Verrucomicrobiae bacterium]|nr:Fic family protein [Verrucomicrobiae bacterium]